MAKSGRPVFGVRVECTVSCRFQSRFIQPSETRGKDDTCIVDTTSRIDDDTDIDLSRFMFLDRACRIFRF